MSGDTHYVMHSFVLLFALDVRGDGAPKANSGRLAPEKDRLLGPLRPTPPLEPPFPSRWALPRPHS